MKKILLTLCVLLGTVGAWAQPAVDGKTFKMHCARGYVYGDGSKIAGTTDATQASEFAIVEFEGQTYLYDATNKAFVIHTTAAKAGTTGNNALESNSDFSKAVTGLKWTDTEIDQYPYALDEETFENRLNMDGKKTVYFNTWMDFEGGNGGNTYAVEVVDDFDDAEAVAMLDAYFNPTATVVYKVSDANGLVFTSEAIPATIDDAITEYPANLRRAFCSYDVTEATIAAGENTIQVKVTYNLPFKTSASFNDATWYYSTIRGTKYLRADEEKKDASGRYQTNETNEKTDVYKWAFMGNPYSNFYIINKGAGEGKYLALNTQPAMEEIADPSTVEKAQWAVTTNGTGYTFRSITGANIYLNDAGGAGNLGFWNSASGLNDAGSRWDIEEILEGQTLLSATIETANARYAELQPNAGGVGYPSVAAITTFKQAIDEAQAVCDNPAGNYEAANAALETALAAVVAPESINYTPRTDVYYTIVNARGAMVYDPAHSESVDVNNDNAEYIWYNDSEDFDATDVNNLWGFIESEGKYYMYNVGKQQFATVGKGGYGDTWIFSNTPAYITLDNGIAEEIAVPKVRVRATIATTQESYTMSVSKSYTGPVITYDGKNDGGVPMLFTVSTVAQDDDVTTAIQALLEDVTPYREALQAVIEAAEGKNIGEGLGEYATSEEFTAALEAAHAADDNEKASKEDLQTAMNNLEAALAKLTLNLPKAGFYNIIGGVSGKFLTGGYASNSKFAMTEESTEEAIFYFDGNHLFNFGTGLSNGMTASSWDWTSENNASEVVFQDGQTDGGYAILSGNANFYDNGDNSDSADRGSNVTINASTNSRYTSWILEEVAELPVAISDAGYATLYAPVALKIANGVTAYTATIDGNYLQLHEIEGTTIPAETAVIIAGEAQEYIFRLAEDVTLNVGNDLIGSLGGFAKESKNLLTLQNIDEAPGFYKYTGNVVRGFKAYLEGSEIEQNDPEEVKGLPFRLTADAIQNLLATQQNGLIYNLAGQRVQKAQKGVYIQNGRKAIVK